MPKLTKAQNKLLSDSHATANGRDLKGVTRELARTRRDFKAVGNVLRAPRTK